MDCAPISFIDAVGVKTLEQVDMYKISINNRSVGACMCVCVCDWLQALNFVSPFADRHGF